MRTNVLRTLLGLALLLTPLSTVQVAALEPQVVPEKLFIAPDAPLPVWVEASAALDQRGQLRRDLLGESAIALQQALSKPSEVCLPFDDAHISYAMPPRRGSLEEAVQHSRTRLLAKVTGKAYGLYSSFVPGQLLQVEPIRTYGKPLPEKHYYVFLPVGHFALGKVEICKDDPSYAEPPEVGGEVFLFIAGPPRGIDGNLLMTYGPGDIVPVGRDGTLWLPRDYRPESELEKAVQPSSREQLLSHLDRLFPPAVQP